MGVLMTSVEGTGGDLLMAWVKESKRRISSIWGLNSWEQWCHPHGLAGSSVYTVIKVPQK